MKHTLAILTAVIGVGALGGCATPLTGSTYNRSQVGQEESVRMGVVEGVRMVQIEGTQTGVGTLAGAAVGGIAGSNLGEGKGSAVGAILGAVGGGIAGNALENAGTKKQGVEITVRLDSGRLIAVTQQADPNEQFRPGDRVRVLSGGGTTRVTH